VGGWFLLAGSQGVGHFLSHVILLVNLLPCGAGAYVVFISPRYLVAAILIVETLNKVDRISIALYDFA
jgi:hypothetical protein